MRRDTSKESQTCESKEKVSRKNKTSRPSRNGGNRRRPPRSNESSKDEVIGMRNDGKSSGKDEPSNNPLWYVLDKEVMEQASRLSFNNILGVTRVAGWDVPAVMVRALNPCPMTNDLWDGTQTPYAQKMTGINLASYKLYNQLATITGRAMQYAPQDLSIMILQMGELISMVEYVRRIMGVYFVYNERNRVYPKGIIEWMGIDSDDLALNYSNYRTELNSIITTINAIPIPARVAYFDKCAELYEKVYLDSPSPCAQTIIDVPWTTWIMDEQSYQGGTVLVTTDVTKQYFQTYTPRTLRDFLDKVLKPMVSVLLQSSTLNLVYADILNYSVKQDMPLWKFDYISEGYSVLPEYKLDHLLQIHNTVIIGPPAAPANDYTFDGVYTPNNDVYPDASLNRIVFNPAFNNDGSQYSLGGTFTTRAIIDMPDPNPSVEDRTDMTRYLACAGLVTTTTSQTSSKGQKMGAILGDHYAVRVALGTDPRAIPHATASHSVLNPNNVNYNSLVQSLMRWNAVSYAPLLMVGNWDAASTTFTNIKDNLVSGDVDSATTIDRERLARVNELYSLGVFTVR